MEPWKEQPPDRQEVGAAVAPEPGRGDNQEPPLICPSPPNQLVLEVTGLGLIVLRLLVRDPILPDGLPKELFLLRFFVFLCGKQ